MIGGEENPYLRRWYVIPRNRWFNIYLHEMLRSDDDRALHDHPWLWCSIFLRGRYLEYHSEDVRFRPFALYGAGSVRVRRATFAHRLVLHEPDIATHGYPLTLFITGPKVREWGFHCPQGWRHWRDFTDRSGARVGRGCA